VIELPLIGHNEDIKFVFYILEARRNAGKSLFMNKARFHIVLLSALMVCGASAAEPALPMRGPDYFRDASDLASALGSAHAIRVRCNGREDQYWRQYMSDMLSYEAPDRGNLRSSLVEQFNNAFQDVSRTYLKCDNRAVEAEARFAREGQEIAERMAMHYFPKKPN
jgi:uncharacterized protein (TIGR02301 family)